MNYMKVVPCDIANGPGVRVTLFCAGCNHHCPGCQNPTTWDPNGGQPFTDEMLDKILIDLMDKDLNRICVNTNELKEKISASSMGEGVDITLNIEQGSKNLKLSFDENAENAVSGGALTAIKSIFGN